MLYMLLLLMQFQICCWNFNLITLLHHEFSTSAIRSLGPIGFRESASCGCESATGGGTPIKPAPIRRCELIVGTRGSSEWCRGGGGGILVVHEGPPWGQGGHLSGPGGSSWWSMRVVRGVQGVIWVVLGVILVVHEGHLCGSEGQPCDPWGSVLGG